MHKWSFNAALEIRNALLYDNLIEDPIFVGIAFPKNYFANRNRDLTPTHTNMDSASGGAPKFLEVIRTEIMKKIDSAYRTDKTNNGLQGSSSGGLFVLYTLFNQPGLFNRYIANSPSLFYDDGLIFKIEKSFAPKNHVLKAKLFMSNGGYEEENDFPPWFGNFKNQLQVSNYSGLEVEALIIDKMGHLGQGFYAVGRGLEFVYGKPDITVDTLLLNQYAGHYEQGLSMVHIDNALYIDLGSKKLRLSAESNNIFYLPGANGEVMFKKNESGKVISANFSSTDGIFISKKID